MKFYLKLLLLILSISYIFAAAKALDEECGDSDTCVTNAECVDPNASGTKKCACKTGYTKSGTDCVANASPSNTNTTNTNTTNTTNPSTTKDPDDDDDTSSFIKISLLSLLALLF